MKKSTDLEAEEVAVYTALIKSMYRDEMLVITDTTDVGHGDRERFDELILFILQNIKHVYGDTWNSFCSLNMGTHPLRADMELGIPYVLVSEAQMQELFNKDDDLHKWDGWKDFYALYPKAGGILTLSRVGFNSSANQALVYSGQQSDWLAGSGSYHFLKKVDGTWVVDDGVMAWIS